MLLFLVFAACAACSFADVVPEIPLVPSPPVDAATQQRLEQNQRDLEELSKITGEQRASFRASKWVSQSGIHTSKPSQAAIEIRATEGTSDYTHQLGAKIIFNLVQFINPAIFNTMSQSRVSLGIFSLRDRGGPTVFPEFAGNADRPECANTCAGNCVNTCTFDGRKYTSLAGLATTTVAAVLDDTILCNNNDPYYGKLNVAVHEFGHSLHMGTSYMVSPYSKQYIGTQIKASYDNAKRNQIWDLSSYAMANEYEYWAEALGVYMNTDQHFSAGGMNKCDGYNIGSCANENASRWRLYQKDPLVYNALTEVMVSQDPNKLSGLKTCMK